MAGRHVGQRPEAAPPRRPRTLRAVAPGAGSGRAQRQLIESLGGTYHQLADADIPAALLAFAHAEHATQLVLGATRHTWRAALQPMTTITSRVIRQGGGIGVHIVTCTPTASGIPPPACESGQ